MNFLNNFIQNIISGNVMVILFCVVIPVISVFFAVLYIKNYDRYVNLFFPEKYDDLTLFYKEPVNSFKTRGRINAVGSIMEFKFEIYNEALLLIYEYFGKPVSGILIKDFREFEFKKSLFGIIKLVIRKKGQNLSIYLSQKQYETINDFIKSIGVQNV